MGSIILSNRVLLENERENCLHAAQWFFEHAVDEALENAENVIRLTFALSEFLMARGYWNDLIRLSNMAIHCASLTANSQAYARSMSMIGEIHLWRGEIEEAKKCLLAYKSSASDDIYERQHETQRRLLARIATQEGDYDTAEKLLQDLVESARLSVDNEGRAARLVDIGIVSNLRGDYLKAKERFLEALELDEQMGSMEGQSVCITYLAYSTLRLGEAEKARDLFEKGLEYADLAARISTVGQCHMGLAEVYANAGDFEKARHHVDVAIDIFRRVGMHREVEVARSIFLRTTV